MPTFTINRARLPLALFKEVVQDIELAMKQYGKPVHHGNEEARSRFLAPVCPTLHSPYFVSDFEKIFNRTVARFHSLILNDPETLMPGRIATQGRIEYHFKVIGGLTVLFVEVKLFIGSDAERMNAIAQVIAEADGESKFASSIFVLASRTISL